MYEVEGLWRFAEGEMKNFTNAKPGAQGGGDHAWPM